MTVRARQADPDLETDVHDGTMNIHVPTHHCVTRTVYDMGAISTPKLNANVDPQCNKSKGILRIVTFLLSKLRQYYNYILGERHQA